MSFLSFFLQLGWNRRFNRLVVKYHPNVWHFFDYLKRRRSLCSPTNAEDNDGWKQANLLA
jgi:hypothetical protein